MSYHPGLTGHFRSHTQSVLVSIARTGPDVNVFFLTVLDAFIENGRSVMIGNPTTSSRGTPGGIGGSPEVPQSSLDPDSAARGVSIERVDAETLRFINAMFPQAQDAQEPERREPGTRRYARHSGYAFLLAFLALSQADQTVLPTMRETSAAVLSGNNVRDMAGYLGWSYEVTNQYFILWTTLNLLLQERVGRQVRYFFPLVCYKPRLSVVRALDTLIAEEDPRQAYRTSVKKLAVRVRTRFLDYCGITPSVLADIERLDSPALVQALQGIGSRLARSGIADEAAQRLSLDIVLDVFAPFLSAARQETMLLHAARVDSVTQNPEARFPLLLPGDESVKVRDSSVQNPHSPALFARAEKADSRGVGSTFAGRNPAEETPPAMNSAIIVDSGVFAHSPSRIESISHKITIKDTIDLEGGVPDSGRTESVSDERDAAGRHEFTAGERGAHGRTAASLRDEAAIIGERLDGPGCEDEFDGHWVGAPYIGRLTKNPRVVRITMVSVLMQTHFPDPEYGAVRHPGKLFNTLYKLFARSQNPRQPSEEVVSWVDAPLTYRQIEEALKAELRQQTERWGGPVSRPNASCVRTLDLFAEAAGGELQPEEESCDRRLPEEREAFLRTAQGLLEDGTVAVLVKELADASVRACMALFDDLRGCVLRAENAARAEAAARSLLLGGEETGGQSYTLRQIRLVAMYQLSRGARDSWECETGIPDVWVVASSIVDLWPRVHALLLSCELFEMDDGTLLAHDQYQELSRRCAREVERDEEREQVEHSVEYHLSQFEGALPLPRRDDLLLQGPDEEDEGCVVGLQPWENAIQAALAGKDLRRALDGSLYGMELGLKPDCTEGVLVVWPRSQSQEAVFTGRMLIDNSHDADLLRAALDLRMVLDGQYYGVEYQRDPRGAAIVRAWSRDEGEGDVVKFRAAADVYSFIEAVQPGESVPQSDPTGFAAPQESVVCPVQVKRVEERTSRGTRECACV
jgi:hypothetical protein